MATDKTIFAGKQWGATANHVTGSNVSHVTGRVPVRKYVMRMCNRKLRNIR